MPEYRLPTAFRDDPDVLDALYEAIVGADAFAGSPVLPGATRAHVLVVALQLVDGLVGNGGFQLVDDSAPDLLALAREAAELVGAVEHRKLVDDRDDDGWYDADELLAQRLRSYVQQHPGEFFADTAGTRATGARVRAQLQESDAWLQETIASIGRNSAADGLIRDRFGDRLVDLQESARLLLRPDDMRAALELAAAAGYEADSFAFYAQPDDDGCVEEVDIEGDPLEALQAALARLGAEWVAVEFA